MTLTPKEKANELVRKFKDTAYCPAHYTVQSDNAIKCALIAVDEILSNNPIKLVGNAGKFIYMEEYWQQVKEEIKKL